MIKMKLFHVMHQYSRNPVIRLMKSFSNIHILGSRLDDPTLVIKDGDDDSIVSSIL